MVSRLSRVLTCTWYGLLLIFRKDTTTSHYLEYLIGILRKFTQKIAPDFR